MKRKGVLWLITLAATVHLQGAPARSTDSSSPVDFSAVSQVLSQASETSAGAPLAMTYDASSAARENGTADTQSLVRDLRQIRETANTEETRSHIDAVIQGLSQPAAAGQSADQQSAPDFWFQVVPYVLTHLDWILVRLLIDLPEMERQIAAQIPELWSSLVETLQRAFSSVPAFFSVVGTTLVQMVISIPEDLKNLFEELYHVGKGEPADLAFVGLLMVSFIPVAPELRAVMTMVKVFIRIERLAPIFARAMGSLTTALRFLSDIRQSMRGIRVHWLSVGINPDSVWAVMDGWANDVKEMADLVRVGRDAASQAGLLIISAEMEVSDIFIRYLQGVTKVIKGKLMETNMYFQIGDQLPYVGVTIRRPARTAPLDINVLSLMQHAQYGGYAVIEMDGWQEEFGGGLNAARQAIEQELTQFRRTAILRSDVTSVLNPANAPTFGLYLNDGALYLHRIVLDGDGVRLEPMGSPLR